MDDSNADPFPENGASVGIVMGSRSDWETMSAAAEVLTRFDVPIEAMVLSAHRTPQRMVRYAATASRRGLKIIIAGAGGAAHLPGMLASETPLPVIGVPVQSRALSGLDSLLSIVQMPGGIPVATMAIGTAGATNAGLLAVRMMAIEDVTLRERLESFIRDQSKTVIRTANLQNELDAIAERVEARDDQ